jgi:hypothetical protein
MERKATLTAMDRVIAREVMRESVHAVRSKFGAVEPVAYSTHPWADMVLSEMTQRRAVLAYVAEVVTLPAQPVRQRHGSPVGLAMVDNERRSTRDLRQHAFAAYASAMAYHGAAAAMQAAISETLRRRPNWGAEVAARHTKLFVMPAYARAFPGIDHDA